MKKFWELFQTSIVTQAIITVAVIGTWLGMIVAQQPYPQSLENIVWVVVGFFFGSKYQQAVSQPMINVAKDVMSQVSRNISDAAIKTEPPF